MAFIKRSTVIPTHAKVGKHMLRCASCGKQFVANKRADSCPSCFPKTEPLNNSETDKVLPELDTE